MMNNENPPPKMDCHSESGRTEISEWIDSATEKQIPNTLRNEFSFYYDVRASMRLLLNQMDTFPPESIMGESARSNWAVLVRSLKVKSNWNQSIPVHMKEWADTQARRKVQEDPKIKKNEFKKKADMDRHITLIRATGAFVHVENFNIAIPKGVSLSSCPKSLEFLKKKGFTTTRATF